MLSLHSSASLIARTHQCAYNRALQCMGGVAQLGERRGRNAEVGSSILLLSTTYQKANHFWLAFFLCRPMRKPKACHPAPVRVAGWAGLWRATQLDKRHLPARLNFKGARQKQPNKKAAMKAAFLLGWRRRWQTKPDEYQLVSVILAFWWAIRWAIPKRTRKPRESQKNTRVACFVTFWRFAPQKTAKKAIFTLGKAAPIRHRHFFIFCFPWARGVTAREGVWGHGAGLGVAWGAGWLAGWAWGWAGVLWGRKKTRRGIAAGFLFWVPLLWVIGLGFGWRWPRVGNRGIGLFHRLPNR